MANNEVGFTLKINGVEQTVRSLADLQGAIRDLTKEAQNADYGSKEFEDITARIQKAKAAVKEFKNDTRTKEVKDQFNDLAGGVASSFDVAEGALKSFGVESKALGTISSTANGLITAALNARQIAELKVDAAVALKTTTEKAAAVATRVFGKENLITNAILSANPIGLIVTALAALVLGLTVAVGAVKKFAGSFKPLSDAIDFVIAKARDFASIISFGLIDDAATAKTRENADKMIEALDDVGSAANKQIAAEKRKLAVMEASGAKEKDILAQKKKINQEEVASRQAAVEQLLKIQAIDGKLDDDKKKKLNELQSEIADLNNQSLVDQAAFEKEKRDKQKEKDKEAAQAAKEHKKEMLDQIYSTMVKTKELENQAKLDTIKNEDEKAKATLRIQQDAQREELQHTIDAFDKDQAERRKKGQKVTEEEIRYRKALTNQLAQLATTQAADMQVLEDSQKKAQLEKEKAFQTELNDIKSQGAILAISNARDRARAELQIELDKQIQEINASELTEKQKGEKIAAVKDVNAAKSKEQEAGFQQEDIQNQLNFNQWKIGDEKTTFDQKLALNKENEDLLTKMTFANENDRTVAFRENAKARKEIEDAAFQAKIANVQAVSSVVGAAADLAGRETVAGKALSVAQTTMDTYVAAQQAYKAMAGIPVVGPALGAIAAAIAVAGGLMNVKKILSVQVPTNNAGGGGAEATPQPSASKFASGGYVSGAGTSSSDSIPAMLSNGESVINASSTKMFGGLLNQINQAGGGAPIAHPEINNGAAPIFKTYVVASDVSSQQEADKRIKDISRV